jgi:hypothetical protein
MCAAASASDGPAIETSDVTRFYALYTAAREHPSPEQLQSQYIQPGTDGLHRLAAARRVTGAAIAANLEKHPEMYANARQCMAALPQVRRRLVSAFGKLRDIYPEAAFPSVTIAVSRGKPVGIADASGVIIGLEALCAVTWMSPNVEDRFVHIIAHEYTHVQQARAVAQVYDDPKPTVLQAALIEGAAEFTAELISGEPGEVTSASMTAATKGREKEIESAFVTDENETDLSKWIDNSSMTTQGDLGYWVGYRIVKSYYQHAIDKRIGFRDIIQMSDPKAFVAKSGWYPGVQLP